mgnify:FL=1
MVVPVVTLLLIWAVALLLAAAGYSSGGKTEPLTLSEAAALRDGATIVRLISQGKDPNAAYRVRAGFLSEQASKMTPLEAAIEARRSEIVQVLIDSGLVIHEAEWNGAWCSATDSDVRAVLETVRPVRLEPDCSISSPVVPSTP